MSVFRFKQFSILQANSAMKVGTDAMLLGCLVASKNPANVLDIGTGTGVLALMLAQRFSNATITAIEIDPPAYLEAETNFKNSVWSQRLKILNLDFLQFKSVALFDCIVSNPPYYQTRLENQDVRKSQARHESALPMNSMLSRVEALLHPEGSFWMIVPNEIVEVWKKAAHVHGLNLSTSIAITGKEGGSTKRNILEFRKTVSHLKEPRFVVRNTDNSYTEEYIELTKGFHFNDVRKK